MGKVRLPHFKSAPVIAKSSPPFCFNRHLHYRILSLIYSILIDSHIHLIHSLFYHAAI